MEKLIWELNAPSNQANPGRINEIQKQIQRLQRDRSSWQLALNFLKHDDSLIRFYGALTLIIKINADWDKDSIGEDERMRNHLLEALTSSYVGLTLLPDATFVLQKSSSTLVAYFQKHDSQWTFPLAHVLACLIQGYFVPPGQVPPFSVLLEASSRATSKVWVGILRFAVTMAEDLSSRALKTSEADHLFNRVVENANDVWRLFRHVLVGFVERYLDVKIRRADLQSNQNSQFLEEEYVEMIKLVLQAIPGWVGFLKPKASSASNPEIQLSYQSAEVCVSSILHCIDHDHLAGLALQTTNTLLAISPRLLTQADRSFPRSVLVSQKAEKWVSSLVSGDFDSEAIIYVDFLEALMSQVDTTTPDFARSDRYQQVLFTLERLLRCQGVAVIEDSACQIALEAASQVVEGFNDWVDGDVDGNDFIQTFIKKACAACLLKIKIPESELSGQTQTWDADERAKFQDFRYDVQDFFQSAFVTLGLGLVQEIAKTILEAETTLDWSLFEASLFSLTAFSDIVFNEPVMYDLLIMDIFRSIKWQRVMESTNDVPDRVRQTCIRFISENTGYLQRHAEDLVPILNFLFSSLHLPASAGVASRAIYSLCDTQRAILVDGLPQFLNSLTSISDLNEVEQHRIFGSVASLVQALPSEEAKMQPLSQIISMVTHSAAIYFSVSSESEDGLREAVHILQTLAAIGRGLRVSADTPIDLETSDDHDAYFWTEGPGSTFQHEILALHNSIMGRSRTDSALTEGSCDFIKSGFTETHPSPFKFSTTSSLDLVGRQISVESPNIDAVMACASGFLASVSLDDLQEGLGTLLYHIANDCQKVVIEFQRSGQIAGHDFGSAILEFMARLMPKWGSRVFMLQNSQGLAGIIIDLALIVMADPDTLPRRAAASFFATLVEISRPGNSFDEMAQMNLTQVLQKHSPQILGRTLRLLGGECARSEVESITEPLKRFTNRQPMLTKSICKEAMKEGTEVLSEKALKSTTTEQRLRFVAQVEGLRGARRTNDVAKDFWILCRGSGFEYIG